MPLSKRTALGMSLSVIALYWIYQIASHRTGQRLPVHFSELAVRIVRTKLVVLATLLVYLRRRSALEPMTAHAFSDALVILGATMMAR